LGKIVQRLANFQVQELIGLNERYQITVTRKLFGWQVVTVGKFTNPRHQVMELSEQAVDAHCTESVG
jgi:hypothetical protein